MRQKLSTECILAHQIGFHFQSARVKHAIAGTSNSLPEPDNSADKVHRSVADRTEVFERERIGFKEASCCCAYPSETIRLFTFRQFASLTKLDLAVLIRRLFQL